MARLKAAITYKKRSPPYLVVPRIQGLQPKDLLNVKDLLLAEPFSVERVAAALGIIKTDLVKRFDLRYPHRFNDGPLMEEYEWQVNDSVRMPVLSYSRQSDLAASFGPVPGQDSGLHIARTAYVDLEYLLLARARRLERGKGWFGCMKIGVREAFNVFTAPENIRNEFYSTIESARPGFNGLDETWVRDRRKLSLRLYDLWYPNNHDSPQDSYVRYA